MGNDTVNSFPHSLTLKNSRVFLCMKEDMFTQKNILETQCQGTDVSILFILYLTLLKSPIIPKKIYIKIYI